MLYSESIVVGQDKAFAAGLWEGADGILTIKGIYLSLARDWYMSQISHNVPKSI